jgi:hypothetical protein
MRKENRPDVKRKPEDHRESADDSLELAKALAGRAVSATRAFSNVWFAATTSWATTARRAACVTTSFSAQVAREMIEAGE